MGEKVHNDEVLRDRLCYGRKVIKEKELTDEEILEVYHYQQKKYTMMDVEAHAADLLGAEMITKEQYDLVCEDADGLAEEFLMTRSDCTLAENDVYEEMILNYLRDAEKYNMQGQGKRQ